MDIHGLTGPGSLSFPYQTAIPSFSQRQDLPSSPVATADKVSISQAARDLFVAPRAADATAVGETSARSASSAVFDTDKGRVELDLDAYFSSTPRNAGAGLPPLLMPTQENIDALNRHVSGVFPGFLSDNGIPYAPASITYDTHGHPVFPADYPYAAQLGKALDRSPSIAREISSAYALAASKVALDDALKFQDEYRRASNMQELQAVIEKYSALLSGNSPGPQISANFTLDGHMTITAVARLISS